MKTQATMLYPFVPSGPHFARSLEFFAAFGFHIIDPAGVCWHVRQSGG